MFNRFCTQVMAKALNNYKKHTFSKVPALITFGALSLLLVPQFVLFDACLVSALPVEAASLTAGQLTSTTLRTLLTQPKNNPSVGIDSPNSVPNVSHQPLVSSSSEQLVNSTQPSPTKPSSTTGTNSIAASSSSSSPDSLPSAPAIARHIVIDTESRIVHAHSIHSDDITIPNTENNLLWFQVPFEIDIVVRVFVFIYCCLVIGYLCDEFFVPSLESIGESLNWSNDLIAAVLIPFGTSGPEIFSSAVGVFFAENDIGTGAIIGSAAFNMFAIPAASALAAVFFLGGSVDLQEFSILRDLVFYIVSIIVLILAIKDNVIDLLDASLMGTLFVIYIVVIMYNAKFSAMYDEKANVISQEKPMAVADSNNQKSKNLSSMVGYQSNQCVPVIKTIQNDCKEYKNKGGKNTKNDTNYKIDMNNNKNRSLSFNHKFTNSLVTIRDQSINQDKIRSNTNQYNMLLNDYYISCLIENDKLSTTKRQQQQPKIYDFVDNLIEKQNNENDKLKMKKSEYEKLSDEDDNGVGFTDNIFLRWLLMPFVIVFGLTMPIRYKYLTFVQSICWLATLSYATVWSISGLSEILAIPPTISGMTILAAGSAVPDLVTSIIVIKKTGTASMGICAAIASNIFAILLGLGMPWGIQFVLNWYKTGHYASSAILLHSSALPYTSIVLLLAIFALYFTFRICNWKMTKQFALLCGLIHMIFVCSGIALELLTSS